MARKGLHEVLKSTHISDERKHNYMLHEKSNRQLSKLKAFSYTCALTGLGLLLAYSCSKPFKITSLDQNFETPTHLKLEPKQFKFKKMYA